MIFIRGENAGITKYANRADLCVAGKVRSRVPFYPLHSRLRGAAPPLFITSLFRVRPLPLLFCYTYCKILITNRCPSSNLSPKSKN